MPYLCSQGKPKAAQLLARAEALAAMAEAEERRKAAAQVCTAFLMAHFHKQTLG